MHEGFNEDIAEELTGNIKFPSPSANLRALVAFSQTRAAQEKTMLNELNDPPPPSTLTTRAPSSRRTLTRALELARQAVQLDANDNPQAAVQAYGHSVALLSEVMERVRRGEDSSESRRRNGRRRSSVAQEDEVKRLQGIHDTYADRMNILSIIHSIPPIPYAATSVSSPSSSPTATNSTTDSPSPPPDSTDYPPFSTIPDPSSSRSGHDPEDGTEAIGSAMFALDDPSSEMPVVPGLPSSSFSHPYAAASAPSFTPQSILNPSSTFPAIRSSILQQRSRAGSSALPPAPPPPSNALPPAPNPVSDALPTPPQSYMHVTRPHTEPLPLTHRSNSNIKLEGLPEEIPRDETLFSPTEHQHPPNHLPPPSLEDESHDMITPRSSVLQRPPSPPSHIIVPRPRGSSTLTTRSELASSNAQLAVNSTTNLGTIHMRRTKSSAPPDSRSSSPTESTGSTSSGPLTHSTPSSLPGSSTSSIISMSRSRSSSQPSRPGVVGTGTSPPEYLPPLPPSQSPGTNGTSTPRKSVFLSRPNTSGGLSVQTDLIPPPVFGLPTTPTSPLPPNPPSDPIRKPYYMMNLLRGTMESATGGYVTRRLHVPQEVWSQGGAKLSNTLEKVRVVGILCQALEELQMSSSEYFGAGNVSSGMALGIGSIGQREAESWIAKLDEFSGVCEAVVSNVGKKLGVGEGFVTKKSTWSDRVTRRFDKFTNGKNLDSPQAYSEGLRRLFKHAQLLDEHTKAIFTTPVAQAYVGFPLDLRTAIENKLRRASQFFASVVLTFVIRDLSQLLDKYAKKCEKWLAE